VGKRRLEKQQNGREEMRERYSVENGGKQEHREERREIREKATDCTPL
jgi:hypothetical protein